ncbi:MAG: tetratricopeptide repeat protein [Pyrinomonadaceae bacterium]
MLVAFVFLAWMAGREGLGSFLTARAARTDSIASGEKAVKLAPGNPDAHLVRGALFEANNDLPAAISEYQIATGLRPDDYVVWLNLARARELSGDNVGAIAAARAAVPLAPYYAQPHWQLGNILVRAGQRDEGFKELGLAGESNPALMPAIIDLVWRISQGDARFVIRALRPQRPESFLALAQYMRKKNQIDSAVAMYMATGNVAEQDRGAYVAELITGAHFREAYSLWSFGRPNISRDGVGLIIDPGFEQESNLDDPGFSWRSVNRATSLTRSLDSESPREGKSSLRIDFSGDSDPAAAIISQLVLVEPKTDYELRCSVRSQDVTSGGLPSVQVTNAITNAVIGQTDFLPRSTNGWSDLTINFVSGEPGAAVQIALKRAPCSSSPCPIFGQLWLDNFSLQKRPKEKP